MNIYDAFKPKVKTKFNEISFFANSSERNLKTILTVDATIEAEQSQELTPTDHPIEKGKLGSISDNLILKPLHLSIKGKIDNEPLDFQGSVAGAYSGAVGTVSSNYMTPFVGQIVQTKLGGVLSEQFYGNRAKQALETLMSLQINKVVLQVVTKLRTYNNLILQGLTIPATSGDGLEFSGSLTEISVVETSYSTIKANVKANGAIKQLSKGSVQPETLPDETKIKTATKMFVDALVSGLKAQLGTM